MVGAGLAGLSAAHALAAEGVEVLVVERGEAAGTKGLSGGRLYLQPVRDALPWGEAPLERPVVRETITLLDEQGSASLAVRSELFGEGHSWTVLRSRLDRWLAEQVEARGGMVICRTRVDGPLLEDGRVAGVVAGEDRIGARVVVAADGVNALFAERAGLRPPSGQRYALGVKEVLELAPEAIEERFGLEPGQGAACLFVGAVTRGAMGGGFLYTNRDTLSLGVVVGLEELARRADLRPVELLEEFRRRPEVAPLVRGARLVEYGAHLIPEGGYGAVGPLWGRGMLVVGDAAGLCLNTGLTLRGMDLAVASGQLAARAILEARARGDYAAAGPRYEQLLRESFVLRDMRTFRRLPGLLRSGRPFRSYPRALVRCLARLMHVGDAPKEPFLRTVRRSLGEELSWGGLIRDLWSIGRS